MPDTSILRVIVGRWIGRLARSVPGQSAGARRLRALCAFGRARARRPAVAAPATEAAAVGAVLAGVGERGPGVAARLVRGGAVVHDEAGDTLIEVLIAALLVALIAGAVLTGYIAIAHIAGGQRNTSHADVLAQRDEARLHSLSVAQLSASGPGTGNQTVSTGLNGTTYTIASTARFVSGGTAGNACSSSGTSSADEVATSSTVTWGTNNGGRPPVVVQGLITPAVGGSLVVTAIDQSGGPLAGATVSVTGPSVVSPLTTDASGCAVFGGLAGGAYTVSVAAPGYVDVNGNSTITQSVTVVPTQTAKPTAQFQLGQAGAISATFTTGYNGSTHASSSDAIVASNTGMSAPRTFATTSGPASTLTTPSTLYPFATPYSVYAGSCSSDLPPSADQGSASVGGGAAVVPLPALIVNVWASATQNFNDNDPALLYSGAGWTHQTGVAGDYANDETDSATAGNTVSVSFTGTGVQWLGTRANNHGYANVYLDNRLVARNINGYARGTAYQQVLYRATGLANTSHTLKIVVDGTAARGSRGRVASIDEISASGGAALMSSAPRVTLTDTGCANRKTVPATVVPTATAGALADPGVPYANLSVCADNGTNHNTATVAASSLSFTAGTAVNINLYSGAPGLTRGACP